MKNLYYKLKGHFPYYINHLIVAILLGIVTISPIAGAMFYAGREIRDWEKNGNFAPGRFDHQGFWWPFIPLLIADLIFKAWILLTFIV